MSNINDRQTNHRHELDEWRKKIDAIDSELSTLLCQRLNCAQNISSLKQRIGEEVLQPAREKEVLANVLSQADSERKACVLEKIYKCIIEETRLFQHEHKNQQQTLSPR